MVSCLNGFSLFESLISLLWDPSRHCYRRCPLPPRSIDTSLPPPLFRFTAMGRGAQQIFRMMTCIRLTRPLQPSTSLPLALLSSLHLPVSPSLPRSLVPYLRLSLSYSRLLSPHLSLPSALSFSLSLALSRSLSLSLSLFLSLSLSLFPPSL